VGGEGLDAGDTFAGYRVERDLGSGGMGVVYLVVHPTLSKRFALKVLPGFLSKEPEFVDRFEREMRTVSKLDHQNIVSTTDAGTQDGRAWFTMTFVDGADAARTSKAAPDGLPVARVIGIADAIAAALDYAHGQGVTHRDVKPANILLGRSGRVFLTDFGIAKVLDETHSMTTVQPYTPDFGSPEQIANEPVGPRTDVYSLAATCYTLLTGRPPYPGEVAAKIHGHLFGPAPKPSVARPGIPAGTDAVIATAMARNPDDRYATCAEFARDLRMALRTDTRTRPDPDPLPPPSGRLPQPPPARTSRRGRLLLTGLAVVLVIGGGIGIWAATGNSTSGQAPPSPGPGATAPDTPPARIASASLAGGAGSGSASVPAGESNPAPVVPLEDLLDPVPPTRSGTSADIPVAGAAAIALGPSNCPNGQQKYAVDVGSGLQRITGTFLTSNDADPSTRTLVTVTADGVAVAEKTVAPRSGATIDVDVGGARQLTIDLSTAGSGTCDSGGYLVFLTNAQAYR